MKIAVIGTGYVGLVTGTGLAETGHYVWCVDKNASKIAALNAGALPFYEPGLEELVARNVEEERLRFSTDIPTTISEAVMVFICVGTPPAKDGQADTSQVFTAVEDIAMAMSGYRVIVNKSTCPVGTTDRIREVMQTLTKHPFDVVSNPEFLRQGAAVDDFMRPDRIVVGCDDVRVVEMMKELYAPFVRTGKPILVMSPRSAEMTKYTVNAMLATRISFMNEVATICQALGADIGDVREGLAADDRVGASYLFPGVGYGGSCLPKDVVALARLSDERGVRAHVLEAVNTVNNEQQRRFSETILGYYGNDLRGKKIAIWGASFKPKTDDLRNAPALKIIDALLEAGATVIVYDPVADTNLRSTYGDRIAIASKNYGALEGAHGLVIATEWNEFRRPDFERMASLMSEKVIFDGRNLYTTKVVAELGFRYFSIGRPAV